DALKALQEALRLAPDSARIEMIMGFVYDRQGNGEQALKYLRAAASHGPNDLHVLYSLARYLEMRPNQKTDAEAQATLTKILGITSSNLVAEVAMLRVACRT